MRCPELQACALYSKDVTQMYLFFILKETLLNTDYSDMSFTTYYSTVLEREGLNENNATSSFALWVKSAWRPHVTVEIDKSCQKLTKLTKVAQSCTKLHKLFTKLHKIAQNCTKLHKLFSKLH